MDLAPLSNLVMVTGQLTFNAATNVATVALPALSSAAAIYSTEDMSFQLPSLTSIGSLQLTSSSVPIANFSSLIKVNGTLKLLARNVYVPELVEAGKTTFQVQDRLIAPKLQRVASLTARGSSQSASLRKAQLGNLTTIDGDFECTMHVDDDCRLTSLQTVGGTFNVLYASIFYNQRVASMTMDSLVSIGNYYMTSGYKSNARHNTTFPVLKTISGYMNFVGHRVREIWINAPELETVGAYVRTNQEGGVVYLDAPKLRTVGAMDNTTQPIVNLHANSALGVVLSTIVKIYGYVSVTSWPTDLCRSVQTRFAAIATDSGSNVLPTAWIETC
eukprot:m.156535 g.156535  ORF g.156535 m.156535 type:complete len:331 (-) comp16442_c1_seq9:2091-3083(-)